MAPLRSPYPDGRRDSEVPVGQDPPPPAARRASQDLPTGPRQRDETAALVIGSRDALDQPVALEPLHEARDTRAGEQHRARELDRAQAPPRRLRQLDEHVVVAQRELVPAPQL